MKRKASSLAFYVGSWVGVLQAFLGMKLTIMFGWFAGFLGATILYVAIYEMYMWAFKEDN